MRIAIDTGGTFTDCVFVRDGAPAVLKLPSTPDDPARSVLEAIRQIAGGVRAEVRHGTTIGTNALLERKGARTAFVTTAGFEDTIAIGRQARQNLYDWMATPAPCLVPEDLRFGVPERVSAEGEILHTPSAEELAQLQDRIRHSGAESIAISLLFSFANSENEQRVAACLHEVGLPISVSHQILPEFREYERGATVVVNAYLAPKAGAYVRRLESAIENQHSGSLYVMQSSGGIISAQLAGEEPVRTVLSGPAGGVIGAHRVAQVAGFEKVITFDMGGTSTDVSLIDARGPQTTNESRISGLPISVPMLDIHTVGAGGGSLAWFDRGGILHVGPASAGAVPGPICYGRGEQPTVTDANLVLGRLDPELALAGRLRLNADRARHFMETTRGSTPSVEQLAFGMVRVVEAEMERAIRLISIERGHNTREFTLVAFGGAGPLHACALASTLKIPRVLVPAMPGALSALGILSADVVRDYSRTVMIAAHGSANSSESPRSPRLKAFELVGHEEVTEDRQKISRSVPNSTSDGDLLSLLKPHFAELETKARAEFKNNGLSGTSIRSADLRYAGQGYEINVPAGPQMLAEFHDTHQKRYGHSGPGRRVEVVNVRVRAVASSNPVEMPKRPASGTDSRRAILKNKNVMFGSQWLETPVFDRTLLEPQNQFDGPAIVHEYSATTVVPPGCRATVDEYSNLIIEVGD